MKLFVSTKKILSRALISLGITTISLASNISTAQGTTIVGSQNSLGFTNFSHNATQIKLFQSALAYVSTTDDFAIIKSDPMFVTGIPVLFHPLASQFPALFTSTSQGNSITAPFQLTSVTGNIIGQNTLVYSEPDRLSSANLTSASSFSVEHPNHLISLTGQSGINLSFFLQPEETFTFQFQSSSKLENPTNTVNTTVSEETKVMYFFAQPADVAINNGILFLSLYPQLRLSANHLDIDVGLLSLTTKSNSEGIYSQTINHNGSLTASSPYFNLSAFQNTQDNIQGTFTYTATRPTILTTVAYTSSSAASSRLTQIPESSNIWALVYFSFLAIGAKLLV